MASQRKHNPNGAGTRVATVRTVDTDHRMERGHHLGGGWGPRTTRRGAEPGTRRARRSSPGGRCAPARATGASRWPHRSNSGSVCGTCVRSWPHLHHVPHRTSERGHVLPSRGERNVTPSACDGRQICAAHRTHAHAARPVVRPAVHAASGGSSVGAGHHAHRRERHAATAAPSCRSAPSGTRAAR